MAAFQFCERLGTAQGAARHRRPASLSADFLPPCEPSPLPRGSRTAPRTASGFFLQSITLDDSTPINLNNPLSWGVFSQALDSLAIVPTGYVVGVDRQNHKMEILEPPSKAVDAGNAPQAVPFAMMKMGLVPRAGLLSAPLAVAVIDATILILELAAYAEDDRRGKAQSRAGPVRLSALN